MSVVAPRLSIGTNILPALQRSHCCSLFLLSSCRPYTRYLHARSISFIALNCFYSFYNHIFGFISANNCCAFPAILSRYFLSACSLFSFSGFATAFAYTATTLASFVRLTAAVMVALSEQIDLVFKFRSIL